jgi:1-acyl-sn-glycerol-3-phosphate acyltransferase
MYPNHQGKYDVYGIVSVHPNPCSFVIDKKKSNAIFVKQITDMLHAKRLDKEDVRQGLTNINEVAKEVEEVRRYILFPEGAYETERKNALGDFKSGCFKIALKSKTPIVPVVLVDSYKVFNGFYPTEIQAKSQVHYLPPIHYEEYKDMKTKEIAELVKRRIQSKLEELAIS